MSMVSGVGAAGTSYVPLSGGTPLGPHGARRLAELLLAAPPPLLTSLDLRLREHPAAIDDAQALQHAHGLGRALVSHAVNRHRLRVSAFLILCV